MMNVDVKTPTKLSPSSYGVIVLIGLLGTLLVFIGVVMMNRGITNWERDDSQSVVNFSVPPKPTAPPPPPKPEQQKREVKTSRPALAPVPHLGSGFSGVSLSLPDFSTGSTSSVSESLLGDLEEVVMTEDSVDTLPVPPSDLGIEFPERAKQRNIEGSLLVALHVGVDGRVLQAEIIESDPPGVFEEAVLAAAESWVFTPAKYEGQGVAAWFNLPVNMSLQ